MVGGIVHFGGDLTGTNCFTSSTVRRALTGMAGVHVKEGGPGGGPGGCLEGGVAIGGERSGNGSDGGDFGLLGDGVGVGGDIELAVCLRLYLVLGAHLTRDDPQVV